MIKVGHMFKLKKEVALSTYYKVDYIVVISVESSVIKYRDIQNMENKYTAQICDFIEMFDRWDQDE